MNNNSYIKYNTAELNAISFSSVVERLGGVIEHKGSTYRTLCPWHDDKHPSLVLYEEKGNRCLCYACGDKKSHSVIDYVMQVKGCSFLDACEWLAFNFGVGVIHETISENEKAIKKNKPKKPKKKTIEEIMKQDDLNLKKHIEIANKKISYTYMDMDYLAQFVSSDNSFCKCLKHIFPEDVVEMWTQLYMLGNYTGCGNADDVLFPSIDGELRVHNIKIQHYDTNPQSEQFFHCDKKHIYWLGDMLKKKGEFQQDAVFDNSTLFGEHLLAANSSMDVALVESPKNAVVGACAFPGYVWVAAGNKNNLSRKNLECLRERNVLVLPDADAMDEWKAKINNMSDIANFKFSPFCESALHECGSKGDVADWIIMNRKKK